MKVYIISKEPFPNGMAATNRIKCYAKALIYAGIHCEVIIFTRTEIFGQVAKNTKGYGSFENIPYQYIGKTPLRHKNIFIRQINDRLDILKLCKFLNKNLDKGDIVIGYIGYYSSSIHYIIDTIHKKKAKFVRELCELPYGTVQETNKIIKLRNKSFTKQFPKCDGFIAISETLVNIAQQYKNPTAKIIKIPILVDYNKYCLEDLASESKTPYIFHSGTLYEQKDGILSMLEAFGMAIKKLPFTIHFILTGEKDKSPHKDDIDKLIDKYDMKDKVLFKGYLSDSELKDYLSMATLVLINKYDNLQNKYCFSTKLAEYLAAGKPVIITKVGESTNWLTNNKNAYIIEPGNTKLLASTVIRAFTEKQERMNIAEQGRNICKKSFDYHTYGLNLKLFFQSIQ